MKISQQYIAKVMVYEWKIYEFFHCNIFVNDVFQMPREVDLNSIIVLLNCMQNVSRIMHWFFQQEELRSF